MAKVMPTAIIPVVMGSPIRLSGFVFDRLVASVSVSIVQKGVENAGKGFVADDAAGVGVHGFAPSGSGPNVSITSSISRGAGMFRSALKVA